MLSTALSVLTPVVVGVTAVLASAATASAQTGTALVRHAPGLNGRVEGSIQQTSGESVSLNGSASVTGDLLVPGLPTVVQNRNPVYGGTVDGTGSTSPSGYQVTLNSGTSLRHVIRRTNPIALPVVAPPPSPTGTRSVALNSPGQSPGSFSTLRDLTLNSNVGQVAVPPGTYGTFIANSGSGFTLGVAGATQPAVYNLQSLTLNGSGQVQIAGPVVLTLASNLMLNGPAGSAAHPEWLMLRLASGGVTLNGGVSLYALVTAPGGTTTINSGAQLVGGLLADRLTVNGNGLLRVINQPPSVALTAPGNNDGFLAPAAITLAATAGDWDGSVTKVDFYQGATLLGTSTAAPYQFAWTNVPSGVYALTAQATDNLGATTVSAPVNITVSKSSATVALGDLSHIYDGNAKNATATTNPAGLAVAFTYNGSSTEPVAAGSYTVVGTINDVNYAGTATDTLVIAPATPVVSWSSPADIVYLTPLSAAQLNATANVPGTFAYTPAAGTILGAGAGQVLSVTFTPTDSANYNPAGATTALNVNKAPATVTLGALSQTFDGAPKPANATSNPLGLNVVLTYGGSATAPTAAGSHAVEGTIVEANYFGSATGTLEIARATPVISWNAPADIVYGTALSATQLNATANVPGTFDYSPAAGTVLDAGAAQSLSVTFTPADSANYTDAVAATSITVSKASATVTLGDLGQTYDGTTKHATATTTPAGLAVVLTYDGASTAPTAAGSYAVEGTIDEPNYTGSATGTLVIAQATPVISWNAPADIVYGTPLSATQLNATANVPGTFEYSPAAGTVLAAGAAAQPLAVAFTPADAANYTNAVAATTITVNKATATVNLGALNQTYDGAAKPATATTAPLGLTVVLTYDSADTAPTAAGTYTVTGTIDDVNYTGSATGTLVIARATSTITWGPLSDIVLGTALSATQLNATASAPGTFVYNPAAGTVLPAGAGQALGVMFTPTDSANYTTATATNSITVLAPVPATIAFDGASSGTNTVASTTLSWTHTLTAGTGSSRVVVVGVVSRGSSIANASASGATFNGVPMTSLATSVANAGSGTINRSQLFYLFEAALPPAGTYQVQVTFGVSQSTSNIPVGGAISLTNVSQSAPAGFTNNNTSANLITTTVPATTGSWVVDTVGVGSTGANLLTQVAAMVSRFSLQGSSSAAAGATQVAGASGSVTMSWKSSSARQVHSLAVFSPALSVPTPPIITNHPASQTVNVGANVNFGVTATGTAPLSYQWFKNGSLIPGATSLSLSLTNVQTGAAGSYTVNVSNNLGTVPSNPAVLTVNVQPPVITTQPVSQTANLDDPVTFAVAATGTAPLTYQWFKDNSPLPGATGTSFAIAHVQVADAGNYQVVATNVTGPVPSNVAVLTVNSAPVPPAITTQPVSQTVGVGTTANFSVVATGTAPLFYQWRKDDVDIPGATSATLTLSNVQFAAAGSYRVLVSNIADDVLSSAATLTVNALTAPSSLYNLTGFATLGAGTTGGGIVAESDPTYRKVFTALDLAVALKDSKNVGAVKVIEIMNDLNLGWNEIGVAAQTLSSGPFRQHAAAKLHPALIAAGVSLIDIVSKPGLTIFSANGATIKHATFNLKATSNIVIRNLKFDEMWEWDEASKGDYDSNDWDFIDLSNGGPATNIWIDHCTFTKAYDGITDMKATTQFVTMSWCKYIGDDGATNPNSFVRQQLAALEANPALYPFYNFLRTHGFSVEDIVQIIQGHDKCHLMGSNSLDAANATLSATFHHQLFMDIWDRCVPRLRAGQVHNYNIFVDDAMGLVAKRLRDLRANAMSLADRNTLNNTYSFNPFLNGSISTEGGVILVEKSVYMDCLTPLRNNQTDVNNPTYTGKILSTDTIYIFHETDGSTTTQRGDSTDAGSRMGPFQAPIIPFSWNTADGSRPYPAPPMDDPANLETIVGAGAGAGTISWSKENWLKTNY